MKGAEEDKGVADRGAAADAVTTAREEHGPRSLKAEKEYEIHEHVPRPWHASPTRNTRLALAGLVFLQVQTGRLLYLSLMLMNATRITFTQHQQ